MENIIIVITSPENSIEYGTLIDADRFKFRDSELSGGKFKDAWGYKIKISETLSLIIDEKFLKIDFKSIDYEKWVKLLKNDFGLASKQPPLGWCRELNRRGGDGVSDATITHMNDYLLSKSD